MTVKLGQRLKAFFDSLNEEKEHFRLSFPQILQYKLLAIEEQKGRIIGIAGLRERRLFLIVKSDYQNRGIGQKLTKKVIQKALKTGYDYITLNVFKSNRKAVHIYRKLGFRKVYSSIWKGHENYFMILPLNLRGWLFLLLIPWWYKIKSFPPIEESELVHVIEAGWRILGNSQ